MLDDKPFSFRSLENQYRRALEQGYKFSTCDGYVALKREGLPTRVVVNRVDIDYSVEKAERLGIMFDRLGVKATFFVRLHAKEYNPASFENYRIIRQLADSGHEIGYHSEVVDEAEIWGESAAKCLRRDLAVLEAMFGVHVVGVASHGGFTGNNNLDFWKEHAPEEFGLRYEAYDERPEFGLFRDALYVSDSEWTRWKCYSHGVLCKGDQRSFGEHVITGAPLIYLLVHSDTYYDRHFYE
jgi:hypothetical protein